MDIALELITNKGNPASRFSIGNLQTLRDTPSQNHINTYQELKKFHAKYYSSNIMSAVVISNEPLEKIEKMVKDKFSDIPNKQIDRKAINTFKEKAFDARNKGLFFQYKSPKDENTLQIAFVIDSKLDDFTRKPLAYIGNLIDNENPKGFSVFLKDSGYVTGVETMIQSQNLDFSLFVISLSLTEKGYKEIESLLKYVFGYLRKIDKEGISLERFEEFKKIYAFDFLYKVN